VPRLAHGALCALLLSLSVPATASAAYGDATGAIEPIGEAAHSTLFPIDGPHDLGRNEANGFGGGRGHMGQDMFAECGTPVRAAQGGRVVFSGYEGAAGNYLVIRESESGEDAVYMHLLHASRLEVGDRVETGRRIASVGRTGDADGCHLHFELWTKPGWYAGGSAYDPLPKLRQWDRWS
jgi:murein DD-endopeptidase MepM/ murein hydrolase activator NlpD